jgi:hypothetical protein
MSQALLRETIRQILCEEAGAGKITELVGKISQINDEIAQVYNDVPPETVPRFGVRVESLGDGARISFAVSGMTYRGVLTPGRVTSSTTSVEAEQLGDMLGGIDVPWGVIDVGDMGEENQAGLECSGAWVVKETHDTKRGWGPLLYDAAIEAATEGAGGLTPDRFRVTPAAQGVWSRYIDSRGADVTPAQLDLSDHDIEMWREEGLELVHLTPDDPTDDCYQSAAIGSAGAKWGDSPLSKAYRKPPTTMAALEAAGSLFRV